MSKFERGESPSQGRPSEGGEEPQTKFKLIERGTSRQVSRIMTQPGGPSSEQLDHLETAHDYMSRVNDQAERIGPKKSVLPKPST